MPIKTVKFVRIRQGWMYLAVVIDLYSRAVIGWANQPTNSRQLVLKNTPRGKPPRPKATISASQKK